MTASCSDPSLLCRFNSRGAVIQMTDRYRDEYAAMRQVDEEASYLLDALLEDAVENGLPFADNAQTGLKNSSACSYRCPIGERAMKTIRKRCTDVPWCGELTVDSTDDFDKVTAYWRAYFSDLQFAESGESACDDVLMMSVQNKSAKGTRGLNMNKFQDDHIVKAIESGESWCRKNKRFKLRID